MDSAQQAFYAESRPPPTKRRRQDVVQRENERKQSARREVDEAQAALLSVLRGVARAAASGALDLLVERDEYGVLFVADLFIEHADNFQDDTLIYKGVLDNAKLRERAEQAAGAPERFSDTEVTALRLADRKFEHYEIVSEVVPGRVWKVRCLPTCHTLFRLSEWAGAKGRSHCCAQNVHG